MNELLTELRENLGAGWTFAVRLGAGITIFVVCVWVGRLATRGLLRLVPEQRLGETNRQFVRLFAFTVSAFFGILLAVNVLGFERVFFGLLAGGGIVAVILGFAFREIGENFLAGFFLAFSRPFNVGDLIQTGDFLGVVKRVSLRNTHIRTGDGRDIYIPNAQIFNRPVTNYTRDGLRRTTLSVGISYADDVRDACARLRERVMATPGVLDDPPAAVHVNDLGDGWIVVDIMFWVNTFDEAHPLAAVKTEVAHRCRECLVEGGFTISTDVSSAIDLSVDTSPLRVALEATEDPGARS